MELQSIIMVFGALALIAAPILFYQNKQKSDQNKVKAYLDNLGKEHELTFSLHEFWGSGYALGLDTSKKVLFYLDTNKGKDEYMQINLTDVGNCTVMNEHTEVNGNRTIDQIKLGLTFKNVRAHQSLVFYNKEESLHFTNELSLAEKWKDIVSSHALLSNKRATPVS